MSEVINRTISNRLFRGTHQTQTTTGSWGQIGSIIDKIDMPALVLEDGKSIYHHVTISQNQSISVALPRNYDSANRLYVAVLSDALARVIIAHPTLGTSTVILKATSGTTDGDHKAFFTYQGRCTTVTLSAPQTSEGGANTVLEAFIYEIPDLTDYESYYDKQIGYGTSGED